MKAYKLIETGIEYLREALAAGDQFAYELLTLPLESGEILTVLPNEARLDQVSLRQGRLSKFDTGKNKSPLVELTVSYLSSMESAFVLELDSLPLDDAERLYSKQVFSTFVLQSSFFELRTYEGNKIDGVVGVYGYVESSKWTEDVVSELVLNRRPFGAIGALTTTELGIQNPGNARTVLKRIFDQTQTIIAFAFDDEGWICWTRNHDNAYLNAIRISARPAIIRLS